LTSNARRDSQYLADILEAIQHVLEYTCELTYDEFLHSSLVQDAVLRNIQVIGEATKKLSAGLQAKHTQTPWREMAGMRDKVVHDYFDIDHQVVWDAARRDLPPLRDQVEAILQEVAGNETG
jgi:uncharacterized protein with HEPN domain